MQTIIRKVSLGPLITRYPVCYPSIKDGEITYLSPDSFDEIKNAHYGYIPLGVNGSVIGSYSDFTEEMGEAYNGMTISYYTLQKWMNEFEDYYRLIRSDECHGEFDNAVDYYERTYPDGYDASEAERIDYTFRMHGGSNFYEWLIDNYFVMLDFIREYNNGNVIGCSYSEWSEYVGNLGCDRMPFPAAVKLLGELERMYGQYSGTTECVKTSECCECVYYKDMGGDIMYKCVSSWMKRIRRNITSVNTIIKRLSEGDLKRLIPNTFINFHLSEKIEDLGVLVSFSQEFVPGRTYFKGEVCDYSGTTYVMVSDTDYNKPYFVVKDGNDTYWKEYYDVYLVEHEDEADVDYSKLSPISGRTVSSLDSFMRKVNTVDEVGNVMHGHFNPKKESFFIQPAENTLLGFMYDPGTCSNMERLSGTTEDYPDMQLYQCDFLDSIDFFYRDFEGNIISNTVVHAGIGDDVNEKILECKTSGSTVSNTGIMYADFNYYKESVVILSGITSEDVSLIDIQHGSTQSEEESVTYQGVRCIRLDEYCDIKCVDHCTVEEAVCTYHLSRTESYPLRYYKVNMNVENRYSDEYQRYVNVNMCDFIMDLSKTGNRRHNAAPMLRKEELLPFVNAEKPVDNIYIDRGYATALDRHLRIGEIGNYEQLEKYGNGIFQIFNADEEIV